MRTAEKMSVRGVERASEGTTDGQTILLIEHDRDIARLIECELAGYPYRVERFESAQESLRRARRPDVDLIVLDLPLPDPDGFEVCRRLRSEHVTRAVPIVIVTALGGGGPPGSGLRGGGGRLRDQAVFVRELVTRIRALLRRATMMRQPARLTRGDLSVDRQRHEVTIRGEAVTLTPTEFSLLDFFTRHPDRVFSRDELPTHLWGEESEILEHNLDVHICALRQKIECDSKHPSLLVTIRNVGFKLVDAGGARPAPPIT